MTDHLYSDLAAWWPLLSPSEEYAEEAAFYARLLREHMDPPGRSVLELGSGGGNNASHMKEHFDLTLVDLSPDMLALSRALNPECSHLSGDMRSLRLPVRFDGVFIHDAIGFMSTRADLRLALETAFFHTRPGGAAVFAPDHVRETFRPSTDCGGVDRGGRGLRYLEWSWDPDPDDDHCTVAYAYLLREGNGTVHVEQDRHVEGIFSRETWLGVIAEVGFLPERFAFEHSQVDGGPLDVFVGQRPHG